MIRVNQLTGIIAFLSAASFLPAAGQVLPASLTNPQGWCLQKAATALTRLSTHPPADTNALMEALISTGTSLELATETTEAARLYGQALQLARHQIKQADTRSDTPFRAYVRTLVQLGGLEYSKARYEEAEKLYRSAVEAARIALPENDLLVRVARNRYALALGQRYQMDKRRAFYLTLKASCVKAFGKRHEETALVLDELVEIDMLKADYTQAAVFAEEALKARRRTLRSNHPLVADSINRLASVHYSMGKRTELLPLLKEALKIRAAAFGPEHPRTILSRQNLEITIQK